MDTRKLTLDRILQEVLGGRETLKTGFYISLRNLPIARKERWESFHALCRAAIADGYRTVLNYVAEIRNINSGVLDTQFRINGVDHFISNYEEDEAFFCIIETICQDEIAGALMEDINIDETVCFIHKQVGSLLDYLYYMCGYPDEDSLLFFNFDFQYPSNDILFIEVSVGGGDVFL